MAKNVTKREENTLNPQLDIGVNILFCETSTLLLTQVYSPLSDALGARCFSDFRIFGVLQ
jgi:hypothetical protein